METVLSTIVEFLLFQCKIYLLETAQWAIPAEHNQFTNWNYKQSIAQNYTLPFSKQCVGFSYAIA